MRELLATLEEWAATDPEMALATVIRTTGSTPRPPGARLLVSRDGRMAGSISGGCLEAAVVEEAQATLMGAVPPRILHYGISDELGWEVGLACGGSLDVLVETLRWDGSDPALVELGEALGARRPVALLSPLEGDLLGCRAVSGEAGTLVGGITDTALAQAAPAAVRAHLASGLPGTEVLAGTAVFIDPMGPPAQLVIIGAVHVAIALARMARTVGYRVVVIDPRRAFLSAERIPDADLLIPRWPQDALPGLALGARDAAVCLAHDPKFEDPALALLLRSQVGYVGAIGSRSTHARRLARLWESGFDESATSRIRGPVGLDLGAATPEEIALSILAEVVASRRGGEATPLFARARTASR